MRNHLRENLDEVKKRIAAAAQRCGRKPSDVKLIAVSKTHPVEILRATIDAGAVIFGENKVQEAQSKIEAIEREKKVEWHLIGHLQSNKARRAVRLFDVIQTIDSIELAEKLERLCEEERREKLFALVQVDLAGEQTKSGINERNLPQLVEKFLAFQHLKLNGLMIVPPFFEDVERVRPFFKKLRELRDEFLPDGELSMGMSHDFEIAIEEGATLVRVGTAIFGARSYQTS